MSSALLLCGYRHSGKDSFYNTLTHANNYKWALYSNKTRILPQKTYIRRAFADALKLEASTYYGIPTTVEDKDTKQFKHYQTGAMVSARDIYIEWANVRKHTDMNYWCKRAFTPIYETPRVCYVITDWRFPHELVYATQNIDAVLTARIYRSDVNEPSLDISSEHSLDTFQTDILIIPVEQDVSIAFKRFPQYIDYVYSDTI